MKFVILIVLIPLLHGTVSGQNPMLRLDLATSGTPTGGIERIYGSVGDGILGTPVCGGADCDGDGFEDVGLASILASPLGRFRAGETALVFGDGEVGGFTDTTGFSPTVLKIAGAQPYEVHNAEIWMDDVTGDGIGDLLLCRQNFSPNPTRPGAGALTILIGGPSLRAHAATLSYLDLSAIPSNITHCSIYGVAAYDRFGIWARTGDVDGDGIADIIVGADQEDIPGEKNRGAAYLIRGGPHLTMQPVTDLMQLSASNLAGHIARIEPPSASANYHVGGTVQLGDLDGNGRADVLVAATLTRGGASIQIPGTPNGETQSRGGAPRGRLYIAWDDNFPPALWATNYSFVITNAPGAYSEIRGASYNDSFAEEIIANFDLDGDGRMDLFTGDLVADGINGINSGVGIVFYQADRLRNRVIEMDALPPDLRITRIEGPLPGAIGADTAAAADLDGDGFGDLMVGNPHDHPLGRLTAGSVHVLYGKSAGWPAVIDLRNGQLPDSTEMRIAEITGGRGTVNGDNGDTLCYSAAIGDVNSDGRPDFLFNEMTGNGLAANSIDVGNLVVVSGHTLLPPVGRIDSLHVTDDETTLLFHSDARLRYILQGSPTLPDPIWTDLLDHIQGVDGQHPLIPPGGSLAPIRFFRIIEE